jgi:phage shock protein PspC (stress-responsive transcriptional regulator)
MNCAHCGKAIEADSTFCRHCGRQPTPGSHDPRKLFRRSTRGRIAGVCAGIAEYLDVDVTVVRLVWIVLSIVPGGFVGGLLAYVGAWAVMPDAPWPEVPDTAGRRRLTRSLIDRKLAGVCGGIAEYLAVDSTAVRVAWIVLTIVPGAVVLGLAAYLVGWLIMPTSSRDVMTAAPSVA